MKESIINTIRDILILYFKKNILGASLFGDLTDFLTRKRTIDINLLVITNELIMDQYTAKRDLNQLLGKIIRGHINYFILPRRLFEIFYERAIFPALAGIINGLIIFGENYIQKIKRSMSYSFIPLSYHYVLCYSLRHLSEFITNYMKGNYTEAAKELYLSVKYSLTALLMYLKKKVLSDATKIQKELNKISMRKVPLDIIRARRFLDFPYVIKKVKSLPRYRRNQTLTSIIKHTSSFSDLIKIAYTINIECWRLIDKKKAFPLWKVIKLIHECKAVEVEFYCYDDEPVIEIIGDKTSSRVRLLL